MDEEEEGAPADPAASQTATSPHTRGTLRGGGESAPLLPRVHSVRGSEREGGKGPASQTHTLRVDTVSGRHSVRSTSTASLHMGHKPAKVAVLEAQSPEERRLAILQQQEEEQRRTLIRRYSQSVIHRGGVQRASHSTPFK